MATTTTTIAIAGQSFPYIGVGVPAAQLITPIPSAELLFVDSPLAVTVAAAGADQAIDITCTLPRSFCYVLVESSFRLEANDAADWDSECVCYLTDGAGSTPRVAFGMIYSNSALAHQTTVLQARTYTLKNPPSKLLIPGPDMDAKLKVELFNPVIDGLAGEVKAFYARFLRFDRNQAQHWMVNYPVLTR